MTEKRKELVRLVLAGMFVAIGVILPTLTGHFKELNDSILPMHFPVLLCGFICSWKYGLAAGAFTPLLRSLIFGMPPLYPRGVYMALELATYGLVCGLIYSRFRKKDLLAIYISLVSAMISGRIVWGVSKAFLMYSQGSRFLFSAFITGGFVDALPGILLQLVLVPLVVMALKRSEGAKWL